MTRERKVWAAVRWTIALIGIALILWAIAAEMAEAHDWYPSECCSGQDCREISDAAVEVGPEGYLLKLTGETIPHGDERVRFSPDARFHQCIVPADHNRGAYTRCVFVPARSF